MSQYEKTATIYYTLRAYCRDPFELRQLTSEYPTTRQIGGEWKEASAGGCQNHQLTYRNNPKYRLTLGPKDFSNLVVELRGPKVYQVGLEVTVERLDDTTVTAPFVNRVTGTYRSGFCVLDMDRLPAGIYHVIPSTYLPGQESPFLLNLKATTGVLVEKM